MPLRSALILAVVLAASSAHAQGSLTATPNPYDASAGVALVVRNATAAPVVLDSFRTASIDPSREAYTGSLAFGYRAAFSGLVEVGIVRCTPFYPPGVGRCFASELAGRTLEPADSVELNGFGYVCDICRGGAGGGNLDTLFVYSGGSPEPLRVPLANVRSVASEAAPAASALRLGVSPSPARYASVLTVVRPGGEPVRVVVHDALGREVAILHDGPAPESLSLRLDTAAWPPGVYVVRAEASGRVSSARLVVVR